MAKQNSDHFLYRHAAALKGGVRILFGLVWLVDASLKFQPSFAQSFSDLITGAAGGQPTWLAGWFSFWASATSVNPTLFAYIIAFSELAIAISLIFGFMRKIGYSGGFLLSLMIWSVPEGFGGPVWAQLDGYRNRDNIRNSLSDAHGN